MNKSKENAFVYLFSKTWQYAVGNRKNTVLYTLMAVASECLNTFMTPFVWAAIINAVTREGVNEDNIAKLIMLLSLVFLRSVLSWAFHGPSRVIEQLNAFHVRSNYTDYLLRGVMNMPLSWHTDHHSGDTIDRVNKGTKALYDFADDSFEVIKPAIRLVGSLATITYFSTSAGVVVLVMLFISAWITIRFDTLLGPLYRSYNREENHISESIFDAVSNITTVIVLRVEKLVFNAIMHKVTAIVTPAERIIKLNEWKWCLTGLMVNLTAAIVMSIYFFQNMGTTGGVIIGNVYLLINYLDQVGEIFFNFTGKYGQVVRQNFNVLTAEAIANDFTSGSFSNHRLPMSWRSLSIDDLSFSYGGSENQHLDQVSLTIKRGERIAFVGETGSGKTTLLKVMRDLYHPQSLKLTVDGELVDHGFDGISRAISLVPQDPEIFETTIRGNITLGAEYDESLIRHYMGVACFKDVVESLPKKIESSIKEKGVNLSGGQVQRLALTRGLLASHDKDIVLLDEPTSSLDPATERTVYRNIFEQFKGKTVISSVHRLYLLPLFDTVYVFDKGRIVASGKYVDLLDTCPEFHKLWRESQHS